MTRVFLSVTTRDNKYSVLEISPIQLSIPDKGFLTLINLTDKATYYFNINEIVAMKLEHRE